MFYLRPYLKLCLTFTAKMSIPLQPFIQLEAKAFHKLKLQQIAL